MTSVAASTACLGLRYGTLTIRVESDDASHLDWLREFLTPSFDAVEAPRPARTVRLRTDPVRYADMVQRGPHSDGQDVPCFWLDTGVVRLPLWTVPGEGRTFRDDQSRTFLGLDAGGMVEILTAGEGPAVRNALMRVVRELAMAEAWREGGLVLHAAAVAVGERVVLIAGPKGAGKTTLLIHLLRVGRARFVANDRVVIPAEEPVPMVRGLPTIVKLLRESAGWFPGLCGRLQASRFHHRLTLAEARRRPHGTGAVAPNGFWSLSPAQFCSLVEATPEAGGGLKAIVFPRLTGDSGPATLRRLPLADAAAAIAANQLGPLRAVSRGDGAPEWAWHLRPPDPPAQTRDLETDEDRCRELAARVPAFEFGLGRDAYDDPSSAARFLAALGV